MKTKHRTNTKYGLVHKDHQGYWYTGDNKRLHRLIWEDFYGQKIPDGFEIHHIDMDRENNNISNLMLLSREDHIKLHEQTRFEKQTTTGIRGVTRKACPRCKQGFSYHYVYRENGKQKAITSTNLKKLKQKVLARNLPWTEL